MNSRRWTILIVPHDSDSPRQYEVGERGVRVIAGLLGGAGLLVLTAAIVLFSPWATPGARLVARANIRLEQEISRLECDRDRGALHRLQPESQAALSQHDRRT